jgi:hypothetical protein
MPASICEGGVAELCQSAQVTVESPNGHSIQERPILVAHLTPDDESLGHWAMSLDSGVDGVGGAFINDAAGRNAAFALEIKDGLKRALAKEGSVKFLRWKVIAKLYQLGMEKTNIFAV